MSEIKMTDLIAGETILLTRTGGEKKVLEVLSRTVCLSDLNGLDVAGGLYTPKELNVDGYTIKKPESLTDKYPKDTPVVIGNSTVRYSTGTIDGAGHLICYSAGRTSITTDGTFPTSDPQPYVPKDV